MKVESYSSGSASEFTGRIKSHVFHFTVIAPADERRMSSLSSDTFTLALPHICADGAYRMPEKVETDKMEDENLQFREGGYIDVVLTIGDFFFALLKPLLIARIWLIYCHLSNNRCRKVFIFQD